MIFCYLYISEMLQGQKDQVQNPCKDCRSFLMFLTQQDTDMLQCDFPFVPHLITEAVSSSSLSLDLPTTCSDQWNVAEMIKCNFWGGVLKGLASSASVKAVELASWQMRGHVEKNLKILSQKPEPMVKLVTEVILHLPVEPHLELKQHICECRQNQRGNLQADPQNDQTY